MESSTGGDGVGIGGDCAVGTIVWVRRRNGSWWPGRILRSDELSASHLMSPRSGTPVKLLGREDASVDWYNLEKSKRVKAFRCGEFDACIERAEASQGARIKKREKYARREDAILHALELEKKHLEEHQEKLSATVYFTSNKTSGSHEHELANFDSPEPCVRRDEHGSYRNLSSPKSQNIPAKSIFSNEEENLNYCYINKRRVSKQFRWQDDYSEVTPRMRGLQDFGLRTVQPKRKPSQIVNWKNFLKPLDNHVELLSGSGSVLDDTVHASTSKNSVLVKRKRSKSRMVDESLIKKRDRRRPLVQVLESSAKLSPYLLQCSSSAVGISMPDEKEHMLSICRAKRSRCVYSPQNSEDHHDHAKHNYERPSVQENQSGADKCLDSDVVVGKEYVSSSLFEANDSDSSEVDYLEHHMGAANMLIDTAHVLVPGSKDCEPPEFHEHTADASGVSKWHMKGKRNSRNVGKRTVHASDNCNGYMNIEKAEPFPQIDLRRALQHNKESYPCEDGDLIDDGLAHHRLNVVCDWRNSTPSQSKDDGRGRSHNDSDNNSHGQAPSVAGGAVWEEPAGHFDPVYEDPEPLLFDIDIKVETSYQGEHVPLVSLMSRLNGKAIVGHPVQIELLENGSAGHLVSKVGETSAPPPVWRTGRRTAMQRVPRLNHPTTVGNEDPDVLRHSGHAGPSKKFGSRSRQSLPGKFRRKNSKRSSLSSQKTRTLSSLATDYELDGGGGGVELASTSNDILDGLIKPEGSAPLVACVPVKVVFSRLLEAVGKPPLATAHRVRLISPAVKFK